jgi:hypothetical protein
MPLPLLTVARPPPVRVPPPHPLSLPLLKPQTRPPPLLLPPLSMPLPLPLPKTLPLPRQLPPPRALLLLEPKPQPQPFSTVHPASAAARVRTNQLTQLLPPLPRLRTRALPYAATFPHASPPVPPTAPE